MTNEEIDRLDLPIKVKIRVIKMRNEVVLAKAKLEHYEKWILREFKVDEEENEEDKEGD